MTFERYAKRMKKKKRKKDKNEKIWDELLTIKERPFRSANVDPEPEHHPDLLIPSPNEVG